MKSHTGLERWLQDTLISPIDALEESNTFQEHHPPSVLLRVLQSHRADVTEGWLDRGGRYLEAWKGRFARPLKRLNRLALTIQSMHPRWVNQDADSFKASIIDLMHRCKRQQRDPSSSKVIDVDLEALAIVSEAVRRTHGFSPHKVQLIGALALLEGRMAEMATGEGKTLTASIAAVVAAWRGLPCHVVTANDYLAARDAQIGQPLFTMCQVSVASVTDDTAPSARAAAYSHDIVYTTAKNLLADHLRDGLALGQGAYRIRYAMVAARGGQARVQGVVMRGLYQVIVDEADSVLIDEAVTPLIISSQRPDDLLEQASQQAVSLAKSLKQDDDYKVIESLRQIEWTRQGRQRLLELIREMPSFWRRPDRAEELVQMALYAIHLMVRDKHYVVDQDKIILVDELTGRLALQRTLSLGMQQVLEASLQLPISAPTVVSARSSFQRFFGRFERLGGMTGTAKEARAECAKVYKLTLVNVPTNRPIRRVILEPKVFASESVKIDAIAHECQQMIESGRSVLIGVRSVRASLVLEQRLRQCLASTSLQVLHALEHDKESAIVSRAGQPGVVTIATNMAGRGTDIALEPGVRERGGLHVIVAEVNDFGRIDRQLVGRCARQGDPGSVRFFVSLDDELFLRYLPKVIRSIWGLCYSTWPSWNAVLCKIMIVWAQYKAQHLAAHQRRSTLEQDTELEKDGF